MNLLVVGSVAFDTIKTPFGKTDRALGGSAAYFSLAASYFTSPSVVAVVGDDFNDEKIFTDHGIDISEIDHQPGKSFAWGGEYGFDLNDRKTLFTELNVFENFEPKLSENHKQSDYVFLGNIRPSLQKEVLMQIKNPKFVGLDTMNFWIEREPDELADVLKLIDCLIINDAEARQLTGEYNLVKGAKGIMGLMRKDALLIIKRGEYGLLMFYKDAIFHLPGYPLEEVIDPTGAGDSFAGGFMGFLAKSDDLNFENLKRAAVYGSVMASFCVEKMATEKLQNLTTADVDHRFAKFKHLTHFELI
jgi:sugar/nucleoside kinase (ribokinase family)